MNETTSNDIQYTYIVIRALQLYGGNFDIDIYLKLSEKKFVKICHKEEDKKHIESILYKYEKKGVKELYLTNEDYHMYVGSVRQFLSDKMKEMEKSSPQAQVSSLSTAHDVLKTVFQEGFISADSIKLAKSLTDETAKAFKRFDIFSKYDEFKKGCSNQYLHALLTSYLTCEVVDTFSWGSAEIKQKIILASMMCDILLKPEDFEEMKEKKLNVKSLSKHILQHPLKVAQMLENESGTISKETLTIIKEHHERPNGKGYPHGSNYSNVSVLTSIYIISNYFIEQMFDQDYQAEFKKDRMVKIIEQIKEKFYSGNYRKASEALAQIYKLDDKE